MAVRRTIRARRRMAGGLRSLASRVEPALADKPASDRLWSAWARRLHTESPVATVFDVGANRGQTIDWFRPLFPQAVIHAFEPFGPAFDDLAQRVAGDPLVVPVRLALGAETGEATMYENSADTTNSLLPNASGMQVYAPAHMGQHRATTTVPIERLDAYCERTGVERVDVLKMDVQGLELDVLRGAGGMLTPERVRSVYLEALFVEYYEGQCWADELMAHLRTHGYRLFGFCGVAYDERQGWRWSDAMFVASDIDKDLTR